MPPSPPFLGEFGVSSPYYLGYKLSKMWYSLLFIENHIQLCMLFEKDLDGSF